MTRLGVVDAIFLRTHRGMGTPIALQGIWRTADPVDAELLTVVHAALRTGPLGRRVVRSRVPGARPSWQVNHRAHPLRLATEPVTDLLTWADALGDGLDPTVGPGWRLAAATLTDGSGAVVLTCSHALADGRGLIHAVDLALTGSRASIGGRPLPGLAGPFGRSARHDSNDEVPSGRAGRPGPVPLHEDTGRVDMPAGNEEVGLGRVPGFGVDEASAVDPSGPVPVRAVGSDWADALGQWRVVLGGTFRALWRGVPPSPRPAAPRSVSATVRPFAPPGAVLRVPAPDWDAAAAAHGATPNSLFIRMVAEMLWDSGFPEPMITVSVPVDTRDELRIDNDLAMTVVAVTRADTPATVREKCRAAYEHRMTSPGALPEEILQVIPDRLAYRLSRGAGERDLLCSNLGNLPASLAALGPHACTGVAARAIHPGLRADALPRTRLSAYLSQLGGTYTLALVGLDPDRTATPAALRNRATATLAAFGLDATAW